MTFASGAKQASNSHLCGFFPPSVHQPVVGGHPSVCAHRRQACPAGEHQVFAAALVCCAVDEVAGPLPHDGQAPEARGGAGFVAAVSTRA